MTFTTQAPARAPAVVSATSLRSITVEPLTCAIGAQLSNVDLGAASRDAGLVAEIRALLLKHRVLFFRDQDITRAEHVAFARHFGELEDHPVAGSDPEHPGLVRIYKSPDSPADRRAFHAAQHAAEGRLLAPGGVGVPGVLVAVVGLLGRLVD